MYYDRDSSSLIPTRREHVIPPDTYDDECTVLTYAQAERRIRELRDIDRMLWIPVPDGTIVQLESDNDESTPLYNPFEIWANQGDNLPAGILPRQATRRRQSILAKIGLQYVKPPKSSVADDSDLTFIPHVDGAYGNFRLGSYDIPVPFAEGEVRDGIGHGRHPLDLSMRITPLDTLAVAKTVADREEYTAAQKTIETTKQDMITALRRAGTNLLYASGAEDVQRDVNEGVTYHSYGIPDHTTFDFTIGDYRASIFATSARMTVSMARHHPDDAFQLDYKLRNDGLSLAVADHMPSVIPLLHKDEDPFTALEHARDFPQQVERAFVDTESRYFTVEYERLTDAIPLIVSLLKAPIDSNHEVLTPFFYGVHEYGRTIQVTGPDSLSTLTHDGTVSANYIVGEDGILQELMPEIA